MIELEQMCVCVEHNAFALENGMELIELTEEIAVGRMKLEKKHMNIYEGMHGGCSYALADTISGILLVAVSERFSTTIDGHINYLLPVKNTEYVYCRARMVRRGGRIAVIEAEIYGDKQEIFCTANFTYYCTSTPVELEKPVEK